MPFAIRSFGRSLNSREARAVAVLAAAAAAFLLLQFVVLPGMDMGEKLRAALPMKEKTLLKYQHLVALAGSRTADWQNLQGRLAETEKGLLDSRAPAMANAEMQDRIKQLMARFNIEMRSVDFLGVRPLKAPANGYATVPVSLAFECTLDEFTNLLLAAHGGGQILSLDQLVITALPPRPDKPRKTINVRMVITGLMRVEQPAETNHG